MLSFVIGDDDPARAGVALGQDGEPGAGEPGPGCRGELRHLSPPSQRRTDVAARIVDLEEPGSSLWRQLIRFPRCLNERGDRLLGFVAKVGVLDLMQPPLAEFAPTESGPDLCFGQACPLDDLVD